MNDAVISGERLRVKQRRERIAVGRALRSRCFTSKRDEAAIGNLHHELALRRILRRCRDA